MNNIVDTDDLLTLKETNMKSFIQQLDELGYSLDYIINPDLLLIQDRNMFRINTDTTQLAHFIRIRKEDDVLDIGTNNAALLLVASRYTNKRLIGVEIQKEAVNIANFNMKMNHIDNAQIIHQDIKELPDDKFKVILCNPPFFKLDTQVINPTPKQIARHEICIDLDQLIFHIRRLLIDGGRLYLVHRADRISEIIVKLHEVHIEVKRIQLIFDEAKEEARSVLIEAVSNAAYGTKVCTPIQLKR